MNDAVTAIFRVYLALAGAGARFGLCRTLAWEWWHVEWRARWEAAGACPAPAETPEGAPGP